jgi:CRP/FNR family transcriptional regulator, cyclic AMP receptor protein
MTPQMTKNSGDATQLPASFRVRHDDARTWGAALAAVPLLAALSQRQRRKVAETARIRRFTEGTPLVVAGHAASELFIILDGRVVVDLSGRAALPMGPGSFVGELALLDGGPRSATVVAEGLVVTLAITGRRFRKLMQAEPGIAVGVAEELARRLRASNAIG